MTLEGSLDAFSLPDIFQLLSFTKKTGALHITGPMTEGVVHFATGSVTGASSDVSRQALGRRLAGAGLIDDDQLATAIARVGNHGTVGLGRALHDAGAVDDGVLHEHVVEQTTDAVFDLLRWTRGEFTFIVDEANPDDLGVSLPVDEVIAEARRRLETWETLTRVVPSPDAVVGVTLFGVPDTVLNPDEWRLLALVDGRRTVADLVRVTGRGEFATVRTLAGLVERSLVVLRQASDDKKDPVVTLLRRQRELSALEGRPEPEPEPAPEPAAERAAPAPREPERPAGPPQRLTSVPAAPAQRTEPAPPRVPDEPQEPAAMRRPAPAAAAVAARPTMQTAGSAAVATEPAPGPVIERDPSVNKSLLLRLIAGVRGL